MISSATVRDQPATDLQTRRLRIAICPFDTAYDYELAKLPHDIVLLGNTHRTWDRALRPLPETVRVSYTLEDARPDILIVGVDQWSFDAIDERALLLRLRDKFRGRIIVVNHGSNFADGCSSEAMAALVESEMMVCATQAAKDRWKIERSCVIRRGLTLGEWPQTDYSRGNVVAFQPDRHAAYYNAPEIHALVERMGQKASKLGGSRAFPNFDAYRSFLSSSAIFFNPSFAAPNPGAMVEAQLCGLAVVTTDAHGESAYIRNGENGFASNDMEKLFGFVTFLREHPREIRRIGANGRRTAQALFNSDRFVASWDALLVSTAANAPLKEAGADRRGS